MQTKQKKLLLRCADDSVIIMSFVLDDGFFVKREGTKEEIDAEIKKASESFPQDRMPVISWEEINDSDMPDRTYRNAWITKGNKKIEHDMTKAKEIHKDLLRQFRNCYFARLDTEFQKAVDTNDEEKKLNISKKRQELRDVTLHPAIEKAKTIEDLKNLGVLPVLRIMKTNPIKGLKLRKEDE
jgi:hypothetical protein